MLFLCRRERNFHVVEDAECKLVDSGGEERSGLMFEELGIKDLVKIVVIWTSHDCHEGAESKPIRHAVYASVLSYEVPASAPGAYENVSLTKDKFLRYCTANVDVVGVYYAASSDVRSS